MSCPFSVKSCRYCTVNACGEREEERQKVYPVASSSIDYFIVLVADMRAKQKEYFRTRSKEVLQESKRLERKVDEVVKQFTEKDLFS